MYTSQTQHQNILNQLITCSLFFYNTFVAFPKTPYSPLVFNVASDVSRFKVKEHLQPSQTSAAAARGPRGRWSDGLGQMFCAGFAGNRVSHKGSCRGCAERHEFRPATFSCCRLGAYGCEAGELACDQQVHRKPWGKPAGTQIDRCRWGWKAWTG